jgi:hypothetical protein
VRKILLPMTRVPLARRGMRHSVHCFSSTVGNAVRGVTTPYSCEANHDCTSYEVGISHKPLVRFAHDDHVVVRCKKKPPISASASTEDYDHRELRRQVEDCACSIECNLCVFSESGHHSRSASPLTQAVAGPAGSDFDLKHRGSSPTRLFARIASEIARP